MKSKATLAARVVLGLVFVVFGLNKLLHFIPQPPVEGAVATFMAGLAASHYFFPLLATTEVVAGAALLAGRYVPLALTVLAPVIVNIVAVHVFLAPSGLPVAIVVLALEVFLARSYRAAFQGILRAREEAGPAGSEPSPGTHAGAHAA